MRGLIYSLAFVGVFTIGSLVGGTAIYFSRPALDLFLSKKCENNDPSRNTSQLESMFRQPGGYKVVDVPLKDFQMHINGNEIQLNAFYSGSDYTVKISDGEPQEKRMVIYRNPSRDIGMRE